MDLDRLCTGWERRGAFGGEEGQRSVRPLTVVVSRVAAEHVFEVAAAEDQKPVGTFRADGADEALGIGVRLWRANRCLDHLDAFAAEDLVEGGAWRDDGRKADVRRDLNETAGRRKSDR
jgi:hypothetical protein